MATSPPTRNPTAPDAEGSTVAKFDVAQGLIEARHLQAIGPALGLYLFFLKRKPFGTPMVAGGRPVPVAIMRAVTGASERTIRAWLRRLERGGYILTSIVNNGGHDANGIKVRILKAKDWTANKCRMYADPEPVQKTAAAPRQKTAGGDAANASGATSTSALPHRFKRPSTEREDSSLCGTLGEPRGKRLGARRPQGKTEPHQEKERARSAPPLPRSQRGGRSKTPGKGRTTRGDPEAS